MADEPINPFPNPRELAGLLHKAFYTRKDGAELGPALSYYIGMAAGTLNRLDSLCRELRSLVAVRYGTDRIDTQPAFKDRVEKALKEASRQLDRTP